MTTEVLVKVFHAVAAFAAIGLGLGLIIAIFLLRDKR